MPYRAFLECLDENCAWVVKNFFQSLNSKRENNFFTARGCEVGDVTIINRFVWVECNGNDDHLYWLFFEIVEQEFRSSVAFIGLQGVGSGSTEFDPFNLTTLQQYDRVYESYYNRLETSLIKTFCKVVQIEDYNLQWRIRVINMCNLGSHVKTELTPCYLMLEELSDKTGNIEDRVKYKVYHFFERYCRHDTRFEGDNLFYRVMVHFIYLEWARGNTGSPIKDAVSGLKRMSLFG